MSPCRDGVDRTGLSVVLELSQTTLNVARPDGRRRGRRVAVGTVPAGRAGCRPVGKSAGPGALARDVLLRPLPHWTFAWLTMSVQ